MNDALALLCLAASFGMFLLSAKAWRYTTEESPGMKGALAAAAFMAMFIFVGFMLLNNAWILFFADRIALVRG